jgi:rare lipoprotein A
MKVVGELQGKVGRKRNRVGMLIVTLGMTASVVASPTVKRDIAATPDVAAKHHWFQIGKASWYGGSFNGRRTANGETYDMNALTCAHRTLPLGTWIRVTNLYNKKFVFLRVNDRGPMATSLILDLSYGAAQRLGVEGLAKVRIEAVSPSQPEIAEQLVAQLKMSHDPALLSPIESEPSFALVSVVQDR